MLIDSNIIIYAAKAEHADLCAFIAQHTPAVSAISYVEVLGYHRLTEQERQHLGIFCYGSGLASFPRDFGAGSKTPPTQKDNLGRRTHSGHRTCTQSYPRDTECKRL